MATIDAQAYETLRASLYRAGEGKEELKARANLPNEAQLKAAFQACEDFWETNKATLKTNIDTALGVTTTNTEAKKIALAWLRWRVGNGG